MTGFMGAPDARAWLSTVRGAAQDLARMERAVAKMKAREGLHAAQMGGGGRSSGPRDANAATDSRMDFETACAPAMDDCRSALSTAGELIWGPEGVGGLRCLMGATEASVLHLRYVKAMSWPAVASTLGMSPSSCRQMADAAADLMDALGPGRVKDGDGCAMDPLPLGNCW